MKRAKFLIAGLGNPGKQYKRARHNIGKTVVEQLAQKESKDNATIFLITQKFMNESGVEVAKAMKYQNIVPENLVVIHDDLDLRLGTVKINFGASSAGHKGVESVISEIKTKDFWRIRIGIGRSQNQAPEEYVLSDFSREEMVIIGKLIDKVRKKVLQSLNEGEFKEEKLNL